MLIHQRKTRRAGGYTLTEVLIAAAILAFVVAALTQAIVAGQMQTYAALHDNRAVSLAESFMDEVLALPYDDPDGPSVVGPEAGEAARDDFDNLDDYHGYSQAAGAIVNLNDASYPDAFQGFTRSIAVVYGTVSVPTFGGDLNGLTITITVTDADGRQWTLDRWVPEPIAS